MPGGNVFAPIFAQMNCIPSKAEESRFLLYDPGPRARIRIAPTGRLRHHSSMPRKNS